MLSRVYMDYEQVARHGSSGGACAYTERVHTPRRKTMGAEQDTLRLNIEKLRRS